MTKPGPSVTSGADTQPGSDSLFPSGFGGGANVRAGGVGTTEIADGSVAAADLNLPSVAAAIAARSELTGTYAGLTTDPSCYDSTRLRAFRAALGNVANSPVDILVVGNSIGEGQGGTAITNRWLDALRDKLRARYQPAGITGGEGYVPAFYQTAGYAQRVTYTGTTGGTTFGAGLGVRAVRMAASSTATFTFTGTGCDITYAKGALGGTFNYTVDGGASQGPVSTATGTLIDGQRTQIRSLSAGSHTVVITANTNYLYLDGFMVYNGDEAAGIRVWDGSHYGFNTTQILDAGNGTLWAGNLSLIQPDLIIMQISGENDYGTDNSPGTNRLVPATVVANLQAILAALRAKCTVPPSVVQWEGYQINGTGPFLDAWANYVAAVRGMTKTDGAITRFDANALIGDIITSNTYGLGNADKIHPSNTGHAAIAEGLFRVLTAA